MPVIRIELLIQAPIERCFDLARSIAIHTESTSQTKERAVGGVMSGFIELGESVTWEAIHFGVKQRLTARITEMERPHYFVDEMVRGAFQRFRHEHRFVSGAGGTRMIDTFDYDAPLGVLGSLANVLFLERYMRQLLTKRNLYIKQAAERDAGPS